MQKSYYIYKKPECQVSINKLPIWFKQVEFEGNDRNGFIKFESVNNYDENWGPNAKIELDWMKKDRIKFLHAKEVQLSIETYNALNIVIIKKERTWVYSHEFTFWYGSRSKMIRKKYYKENSIHGIFYCDLSERLFNIHTAVIQDHYDAFKSYILEAYNSIICH
ncbi:MAG: hypothetical protein ACFFAN_13815 [Promethearchaeota archaeon]